MRDWRWVLSAESDRIAEGVSFRFLNVEKQFAIGNIDWAPGDVSRLWRYNLHYFDYLLDSDRCLSEKQWLVLDWIKNNPVGSEPAWEPYTASLRIVNWCKWLSNRPFNGANSDFACHSLFGQVLWLEQNLELHILANHYFENLKALVFAGVFFEGADAMRWLDLGIKGLTAQLPEQVLADGCHYERTPQYHCIILNDVLDLLQLGERAPSVFDAGFLVFLRDYAQRMSGFLQAILNPLEQYPLFNDSTFYEVSPVSILQRAAAMGVVLPEPAAVALLDFPAAGLFGYRAGRDSIVLDCGEIGPAYQPGHTHCDFLSYELVIDGVAVVVDTGVFEYEPGAMRQYVRQTAAHNVVQVDDGEQSEVWGEFRVARRARQLFASIKADGLCVVFEGGFHGFHALGGMSHQRGVTVHLDESGVPLSWHFEDRIDGKGRHRLRNFIHLHPDITPTLNDGCVSLFRAGRCIADLQPVRADRVSLDASFYCPSFGLKRESQKVVIELESALPAAFGYSIIRRAL
ncbi:MAG: alginate lyase family protein [Methylomonas sp.]|nr:alginate lyase family protein [Methylomonas sp.]